MKKRTLTIEVNEAGAKGLEFLAYYLESDNNTTLMARVLPTPSIRAEVYDALSDIKIEALRIQTDEATRAGGTTPKSERRVKIGDAFFAVTPGGRMYRVLGMARKHADTGQVTREVYCFECMKAILNSMTDPTGDEHGHLDVESFEFLEDSELTELFGSPTCVGCDDQWRPDISDGGRWSGIPPAPSEKRLRGAFHDVRRQQAARILKHYHLPFAVLELHGQDKVSYTFAVTGVTITWEVTGGTEARPISRYYLGISEDVADDWADRMTAALMIARGIEPTMAMKVAHAIENS